MLLELLFEKAEVSGVFALHVLRVAQLQEVVFNKVELDVLRAYILILCNRNHAKPILFRKHKACLVTCKEETIVFLSIACQQTKVFNHIRGVRKVNVVIIANKKLKEDFWLDDVSLFVAHLFY